MSDDDTIHSNETPGPWARLSAFWHRIREPRWARWLIDIALFAGLFIAISSFQTRHLVESGTSMPETTLRSTEGDRQPLADPESERTLLYVWAPWCGVCSAQTGTLSRARALMGDDVAVRSVVFDTRNLEHARRSADEKGIASPVLLGTRTLREQLRIRAFPTFYVLSSEGRVLDSTQGYTTTLGLLWRVWW